MMKTRNIVKRFGDKGSMKNIGKILVLAILWLVLMCPVVLADLNCKYTQNGKNIKIECTASGDDVLSCSNTGSDNQDVVKDTSCAMRNNGEELDYQAKKVGKGHATITITNDNPEGNDTTYEVYVYAALFSMRIPDYLPSGGTECVALPIGDNVSMYVDVIDFLDDSINTTMNGYVTVNLTGGYGITFDDDTQSKNINIVSGTGMVNIKTHPNSSGTAVFTIIDDDDPSSVNGTFILETAQHSCLHAMKDVPSLTPIGFILALLSMLGFGAIAMRKMYKR